MSGDKCRILGGFQVQHFDCDDYPDGTITSVITGTVLSRPYY